MRVGFFFILFFFCGLAAKSQSIDTLFIHQWEAATHALRFWPDTAHPLLRNRVNLHGGKFAPSNHATEMALLLLEAGEPFHLAAHSIIGIDDSIAYYAARGMHIALHAYDRDYGWARGNTVFWHGLEEVDSVEDYHWGRYTQEARHWDSLACRYPHYLAVKSAGNSRGEFFSGVHQIYDAIEDCDTRTNNYLLRLSGRQRLPDGGLNEFDCLSPLSCSKNILTVGSVRLEDGEFRPGLNSAFGPTDDGRVKPDIVAMGPQTSHAAALTAAAAGRLSLLFHQKNGHWPLAIWLKGILIHTAKDLGAPGPDYRFGFGLLQSRDAMREAARENFLLDTIAAGEAKEWRFVSKKSQKPRITLLWNDPPGSVLEFCNQPLILNHPFPALVHPLLLEVEIEGQLLWPFGANPQKPEQNFVPTYYPRDNVLRIEYNLPLAEDSPVVLRLRTDFKEGEQGFVIFYSGLEVD